MAAQFWNNLAASQRKRKRASGTAIDYHSDTSAEVTRNTGGPLRTIRHFNFLGASGGLPSARSAHFKVPASPTKKTLNVNLEAFNNSGGDFKNEGLGFTPLDPFSSFGIEDDDGDLEYNIQVLDLATEPIRPRRTRVSPLHVWKQDERESFLRELMRGCGRGNAHDQQHCLGQDCASRECVYRCKDCMGGGLFCQACIVKEHADNPLHRIKVSKN
jgi:hypothetical protein